VKVSQEDIEFLETFLSEELTEERMKELDEKLKDPVFKIYYDKKLKEKYDKPLSKVLIDYLPMIIMIGLIILGGYLFIKSNS